MTHRQGAAEEWPRCSSVAPLRQLLGEIGRRIHGDHDGDQDQPQAERERQVALAGFQGDGGGHHAGHPVDVPADDHHRADFGGSAPESGEDRGEQREARVPEQSEGRVHPPRAERAQLLLVFVPGVLDRLARERPDDRENQDRLREDHRRGREKDSERAERAGTREQEVYEQPHHDRGQAHECVQQYDYRLPAAKTAYRDRGTERQAQQRGDRHRRQAHAQAEQNDLDQLGVETDQERERGAQSFRHARLMVTVVESVLIDVYELYPRTQPHEYGAGNHAYQIAVRQPDRY